MKKSTNLVYVFSLLLFGCYEVQRDCKTFKTGSFRFYYEIGGEEKVGEFKRTDSYNIDYINGRPDSSSIRWVNDCEFVLTKIKPKNKSEEKPILMKILTTTDSSYTFEYQLVVKNPNKKLRVEKGTAFKINK